MCRSKSHGGARCTMTQAKRDRAAKRRRNSRTVASLHTKIEKFSEEYGDRWLGDYDVDLNHPVVAKAFLVAIKAHKGVERISGEPYINHPLRCAQRLQRAGFNHEVVAVAVLHDAVEDSDLTLDDLRNMGFNERIVSGVDSVTKREGESYPDAVLRASQHPLGRLVKLADNLDNSSEEQLAPLEPARQIRARAKYEGARAVLLKSIFYVPAEALGVEGFSATYRVSLRLSSLTEAFA